MTRGDEFAGVFVDRVFGVAVELDRHGSFDDLFRLSPAALATAIIFAISHNQVPQWYYRHFSEKVAVKLRPFGGFYKSGLKTIS